VARGNLGDRFGEDAAAAALDVAVEPSNTENEANGDAMPREIREATIIMTLNATGWRVAQGASRLLLSAHSVDLDVVCS
jgi:hypothetical protein